MKREKEKEEGSSNLAHLAVVGALFGLGIGAPIAFQVVREVLERTYYANGVPGVPRVSEEIEFKPPEEKGEKEREKREETRDVWLNLT